MTEWLHEIMAIEIEDGRWFTLTGKGKLAHVVAVDMPPTDYIAWFDDEPARWYWMFDPSSAPILNREAIEKAAFMEEPAWLYSTPATWLAARCHGAVILDPAAYIPTELGSVSRVICDTSELATRIARAYRPTMPKIKVASYAERHAA